jgi:FKBP-type peptidyl-prolyl cis-trans isomerase
MKSLFIALFVVLFVSCNDDDDSNTTDYRAQNEQEILDYITQNNLDAKASGTGLYYVIDEIGEGSEIIATSDVSVRYKGFYTDNTLLEENTDGVSFNLQQVIPGWKEGLQYFNEGGSGMLLIPSHLAYGSEDFNGIPGGSVLIFEIEVIDYEVENEEEIVAYIADNNLDATASGSGLYYVIEEEGTGVQPEADSNVTVVYKGYFTNGTVFDESDELGISLDLNQVISGWSEGMQYFKEGGSGKLLIPSSLAYGRYGNSSIPGGAVVIFDVNLKSVN